MKTSLLAALLLLGACAPQVLSQNPSGVSFKYDPALSSYTEAELEAQAACAKYGKKAVLENKNQRFPGDWWNVSFSCR